MAVPVTDESFRWDPGNSQPFRGVAALYRQAWALIEEAKCSLGAAQYTSAIICCHLSVVRAFQAVYCTRHPGPPPQIQDLILLLNLSEIRLPPELRNTVGEINRAFDHSLYRYQHAITWLLVREENSIVRMIDHTEQAIRWVEENYIGSDGSYLEEVETCPDDYR
ncbi:MAG TPA: HEPN domain-containing protein [Methanospirillum sp.]|nr:HEPN domain-containing protein [Methanospirillum sp.]